MEQSTSLYLDINGAKKKYRHSLNILLGKVHATLASKNHEKFWRETNHESIRKWFVILGKTTAKMAKNRPGTNKPQKNLLTFHCAG